MSKGRTIGIAGLLLGAGLVAAGAAAQRGEARPDRSGPDGAGRPDFGRMLLEGLRATEGCVGVEAAQMQSGKLTIIAWFEDKAAVERWYYSEMHRRMMEGVGSDPEDNPPMTHVENPDLPVMVMASVTMGGGADGRGAIPGSIPASQLSIELYTPLPGGAAFNGRLTPEAIEIPHFRWDRSGAPASGAAE